MANKKLSPVTGSPAKKAFKKGGVQYYTDELGNLFSKNTNTQDMVGGGYELERNDAIANETRLQRLKDITGKRKPDILDYGCGNGLFVDFCQRRGESIAGYDLYRPDTHQAVSKQYDCLLLIEVVEHMENPVEEFTFIKSLLKQGGKVMIETSFADWLTEDDSYIEPKVGHCMIFTHKGLDHAMTAAGFEIGNHINDNVRIYAVG